MRELTTRTAAAIEAENLRPVTFVTMEFDSGTVRVNTTPYTLVLNSEDYLGIGDIGQISVIEEGADMQAYGVQFTLTGIPADYIAMALDEDYQRRPVSVHFGALDADHKLIADPVIIWKGRMDAMTVELGETGTVTLSAESVLAAWDKPKNLRYNDGTQQSLYPGDLSMEFVPQAEEKEIVWR